MNDSYKYLEKIAKEKGISSDEVRNQICSVLATAIQDDTPAATEFWKSIPSQDEYPTIDEAIDYITKKMMK